MLLPSRARRHYSRGAMLRRRWSVRAAKFLLPLGALSLLAAIALWPEIDRTTDQARLSFRRIAQNAADTIRVVQPRYQGIDCRAGPSTSPPPSPRRPRRTRRSCWRSRAPT
ncbi:hypothetical protein MVG78_11810 [Roseomonas gilardii subsp. gilardii]|uniref:hypothetical protein n=1 Tax=Roseomonas gilardii TaxID=257708 RepID=UPI001FF8B208|nr:hypothetical protein [Roseomonas gilardii]UPG71277.1 hypothetical protein MVG78_11810 [Roseomonas gilardii subsp. gilardii]